MTAPQRAQWDTAMDSFDLAFRYFRGTFGAKVTIESEGVEIAPTGVFGLFRGWGPFVARRASRSDVVAVREDRTWRRGLQTATESGAFNGLSVIPGSAKKRKAFHESFREHGYEVVP